MQEPFPVVKDGRAAAEIVYTGDGSEPECVATAAKELQDAVLQITGIKIPVISGWNAVNRKTGRNKIVLGKRAYADCEVLKKLSGTDGFAVKRDGDKLYVYGIEGKGTMNGVYALIENNTDLIWARPHREFGTVFSKRKDLEFLWGNAEKAQKALGWERDVDFRGLVSMMMDADLRAIAGMSCGEYKESKKG